MSDQKNVPQQQAYYIGSLRVRRALISVPSQPKDFRCLTYRADDGPQKDDIVLADQVAFDDVLIGLKLMPKRDPAHQAFSALWRGFSMDQLLPSTRPPAGEYLETLLHAID